MKKDEGGKGRDWGGEGEEIGKGRKREPFLGKNIYWSGGKSSGKPHRENWGNLYDRRDRGPRRGSVLKERI